MVARIAFPQAGNVRRRRARAWVILLGTLGLGVLGAPSLASAVLKVSDAPTLSVGIPFLSAPTAASCCDHFFRVGPLVRPGDRVQFAFDNSTDSEAIYPCLIGPTDDFGVSDEVKAAGCEFTFGDSVSANSFARLTFTYKRGTGQPFLYSHNYFDREPFSVTLERIIPFVGIGVTVGANVGHRPKVSAFAQWGDNTPIDNGHRAILRWRLLTDRGFPRAFGSAVFVGGRVDLRRALPRQAWGNRIGIQVCVYDSAGTKLGCKSRSVRVAK